MRERDGLIARVRQLGGRLATASESSSALGSEDAPDAIATLTARVEDLERLVEGLQDSVHRESSRQAKRITELEARTQPAAISKALSSDARARGL